jgi:hypothetical protein
VSTALARLQPDARVRAGARVGVDAWGSGCTESREQQSTPLAA